MIKREDIQVEGHVGTWYVIDEMMTAKLGSVFLLEHEKYGDEVPCVIIDEEGELILEDVYNGFEDLRDAMMEGSLGYKRKD